jgi:hypothetical protein
MARGQSTFTDDDKRIITRNINALGIAERRIGALPVGKRVVARAGQRCHLRGGKVNHANSMAAVLRDYCKRSGAGNRHATWIVKRSLDTHAIGRTSDSTSGKSAHHDCSIQIPEQPKLWHQLIQ